MLLEPGGLKCAACADVCRHTSLDYPLAVNMFAESDWLELLSSCTASYEFSCTKFQECTVGEPEGTHTSSAKLSMICMYLERKLHRYRSTESSL